MYGFVDGIVGELLQGHPLMVLWLAQALVRLIVTLAALWLMTRYLFPSVFRALPKWSYFVLHATWYALLLAAIPLTLLGRRFQRVAHSYCDATEELLIAVHRKVSRVRRLARRLRLVRLPPLLWASIALVVVIPTFT